MKNDSILEGRKISIPPTLLFSAIGKINDIRKATTLDLKQPGDILYILGDTYNELGASEFYRYLLENGKIDFYPGKNVPRVDEIKSKPLYKALADTIDKELVHSVHTPAKGGLIVGLIKMSMAGELGIKADLRKINKNDCKLDYQLLFSESNSRFIVSVPKEKVEAFEVFFDRLPCYRFGEVKKDKILTVKGVNGDIIIDTDILELKNIWKEKLNEI